MLSVYFLAVFSWLSPCALQGPADFRELVSRAPVIAVGKITEIGEPPAIWSTGDFIFAQKVKYKIVRVLRGKGVSDEITVYHYLFKGSPNSDKDRPRLSLSLFIVGNEHILFVSPINPDGRPEHSSDITIREFAETNTAHGAVLAGEDNLREVGKALSTRR